MEFSKSGFWYMVLCWVSALGGIAGAILWAASRRRPPIDADVLRRSLERRLKDGEIDQAEFGKRIAQLEREETHRR
jgi:hypothetical protein